MKMTYPEFLEKLAATPRTWHFGGYGERMIRCGGTTSNPKYQCPLSAVAGNHICDARQTDIGSRELWENIFSAADAHSSHDKSIRNDLLKACGLEEKA